MVALEQTGGASGLAVINLARSWSDILKANTIFHRTSLLGMIAFVLTACGGGSDGDVAATPQTPPPDGNVTAEARTCDLPNFVDDMLTRINAARSEARACGFDIYPAAPPLAWNGQLAAAAAGHARDMAINDYFSHDSQDGRTFSQRITGAGYSWSAAGENIAAGQADVEQAMNAWLNSPGHCGNIMSDSFTEVGVACEQDDSSTYQKYWAMSLGTPR